MRLTQRKSGTFQPSTFLLRAIGLSIFAIMLKVILLVWDVVPFNADEAIVGLMARHTLEGKWSTFFYGQAYMGSLDTTLVAVGFRLFGETVIVIRVVQIILYSLTIITTAILGRLIFRSEIVGLLAALFLAIPTVNTTLYTTISLGGYGEALLIGNLLLIVTLLFNANQSLRWIVIWGILSGFGFWTFGLTMVFIVPTGILLVYLLFQHDRRTGLIGVTCGILCFVLGAAPLVIWGYKNGFGLLWEEFLGSAIAGASNTNIFISIYDHTINLLLFGVTVILGMRPPWEVRWLAVPLLPVALGFWLTVFGITIQRLRQKDQGAVGRWLLMGIVLTLFAGFILTPFGADPSGRYFLPLVVPMAMFAGDTISRSLAGGASRAFIRASVVAVLGFNLWGTLQSATRRPPGITTQFDSITWFDHSYDGELIDFLDQVGAVRGYSNYWVSYPLAFLSSERLIYIPKLPYHQDFRYTDRDNRYPDYDLEVAASDKVSYITTNHPDLDQRLISNFETDGITWKEKWIGDYHVFYELSSKITPEEMGIENWAVEPGVGPDT